MTISLILSLGLSSVFLFPLMSQPLSLGLAIMTSTMFMCIMTSMYISSWYGFILFLIYVGGLLVMFAYVATLSPNILFGGSGPFLFLLAAQFLVPAAVFLTPFSDFGFLLGGAAEHTSLSLLKSCGIELVSPSMISVLVGLAVILLINLVAVVKICYYQQSTLRPYATS